MMITLMTLTDRMAESMGAKWKHPDDAIRIEYIVWALSVGAQVDPC